MPTTITRPDAVAPRLGYGGAALSFPTSRLSIVPNPVAITAPATSASPASDPLAGLAQELERIHGAADCADNYVFPA